jgi:hypothetical protein
MAGIQAFPKRALQCASATVLTSYTVTAWVILSHETVAFEKNQRKKPKASSGFTVVAQLQIAACKRHSVLAFFQMSIFNKRVLMKHSNAREERNIPALRAQIKGAETMASAAQLHHFSAQVPMR